MKKNYHHIKIKTRKQFINIILDRKEKKNALNPEMIDEIQNTLDTYENNANIRAIVISSNSNVFCAGADIQYLKEIKDFSYTENLKDSKLLMNLFKTMLTYPKLIISQVSGAAIGGGCGLITASDIVFATEKSIFGYPEVKIGFIPALVSTFLIKKIRENDARELLLTGNLIKSKKAKDIGLINYMSKTKSIDNDISKFIQNTIKTTSGNSIKETKKMLYLWLDLDTKLEYAAKLNAKNRQTEDFKKGINSFIAKQKINWNN